MANLRKKTYSGLVKGASKSDPGIYGNWEVDLRVANYIWFDMCPF